MHQGHVRRTGGITLFKLSVLIEYLLCVDEPQLFEEVSNEFNHFGTGEEK